MKLSPLSAVTDKASFKHVRGWQQPGWQSRSTNWWCWVEGGKGSKRAASDARGLFCAVTFTSVLHLNSSRWIFLGATPLELSQRRSSDDDDDDDDAPQLRLQRRLTLCWIRARKTLNPTEWYSCLPWLPLLFWLEGLAGRQHPWKEGKWAFPMWPAAINRLKP